MVVEVAGEAQGRLGFLLGGSSRVLELSGWSQPKSMWETWLCDGTGVSDVHIIALGALHLFQVSDGWA